MQTVTYGSAGGDLAHRVVRTFRAHRDFVALVALYSVAGWMVVRATGHPDRFSLFQYNGILPLITAFYLVLFAFGYPLMVMAFVRPKHLLKYLATDLTTVWLVPERLIGGAIIFLLLPSAISVYTSLKMLIPVLQPYDWDVTFMALDRALHGGVDPWRLLQPVLGYPVVTCAINLLYNFWFFVLYGMLFWQAFSLRAPRLRMQFLVTMILLWALLGGLLATLWSTAGPVYYGRVTGLVDPYLPLMDYLRSVAENYPLWALQTQENLWQHYVTGEGMIGGGISAMPSLHVGSSVTFALLCWRAHRWLGAVLWLYAGVIFLGSIHLAWHYAVDSYVAVALTCLIWYLVGRWIDWSWPRHAAA